MSVLAYHITWTTYGTWLPGDQRGWVKAGTWGVQAADPEHEKIARERMAESAVVLTVEQRTIVEQTICDHCKKRKWLLHAVNVRTNHIHVVVTAEADATVVRDQFKAWCSRRLSDHAGLTTAVGKKAGRKRWFTEGGDVENIEHEQYLENAIVYVTERQ